MSILVNKDTRLLVQGITGREGAFHTEQMIAYGTPVVAGVTPGKGGGWGVGNTPIFDSVHEAVSATGANVSIIYVPAKFAPDAILEAADADLFKIGPVTETKLPAGRPHDFNTIICAACGEVAVERYARVKNGQIVCMPCAEKN